MYDATAFLELLRAKGCRFTPIRKAILDFLIKRNVPLSAPELHTLLARKHFGVNKTTVYRGLDLLKKEKIVRELQFGDLKKRYEITPTNHHHHIVCLTCDKIEDVELKKDLDKEEEYISINKKFKVVDHSLEFFGICAHCQTIG